MTTAETQTGAYIGTSVPRKEDRALLTGRGRYVDNLSVPGMLWLAVVRSPHAHARIKKVDLKAARAAEGVVAAYSGDDLAGDFAGPLPCAWLVTEDIKAPAHWPLARDKARYAGDGVAVVVAESRAAAKDAAELVAVDYEPLPAVTEVEAAAADGAPVLHDDFGTNVSYVWKLDAGEVERCFADAAVTVKERYFQTRLIPNAIEPRGVLVQPNPATGELALFTSTQVPHILRTLSAMVMGVPESKIRVVAPDVGGGFGSKLNFYAEEALAMAIARKLGRPVKWIEERSEAYVATIHGRDVVQEIELAATAEGKVTAVRTRLTAAIERLLRLEARRRRGRAVLRRRRRHREGALLPDPADPDGDRAARRARPAEPGNG